MRAALFQRIRKIVALYIATTAVTAFTLLLPCCDEPQNAEKIIARSLQHATYRYNRYVNRPIPDCGECSKLEQLLILERALTRMRVWWELIVDGEIKAPYVDVPYITKDKTLTKKLTKASAEYKKRFGTERPWWWVCSDEEKLERIQRAFETNTPYPEYGGDRYDIGYRLGKAIATYEMWLKRQPPKQDCPDEEWVTRLETAIYAESPFLTDGEEATMKAEYFKKFEKNITGFESSIVHVSFARRVQDSINTQTSVIRMPTGAIALYQPYAGNNLIVSTNPYSIEMVLNWDEWLDFANVIYKYIDGWGEADCEPYKGEFLPYSYWELRLFFANTDAEMPHVIGSYDECPLDWDGLIEFMSGMEAKIKKNGLPRQPKK